MPSEPHWEALDFPVTLMSVQTIDRQLSIPHRRAVVRPDTSKVLGFVSDRYKLVPHASVFKPVHEAIDRMRLDISDVRTSTSAYGAYARVEWVFETTAAVRTGDLVRFSVIAHNSYDTSSRLLLSLGGNRLVSNSSLVAPYKGLSIGWGHWRSLSLLEVMRQLDVLLEGTEKALKEWKRWSTQRTTTEEVRRWLNKRKAVIGKKGAMTIIAKFDESQFKTVWDAYNAMTFFGTHHVRGRSVADKITLRKDRIASLAVDFARSLSNT